MNTRRVKLPLVLPADTIDAAQSKPLQLLALRCQQGDANHRGLLHTVATLARYAVDGCLAPGARSVALNCIAEIQRWSAAPFALRSNALRNQLLEECISSELATANAVAQMLTLSPATNSELSPHTDHVLVRHARQASYQACSAVVLTLDALDEPRRAIEVPAQVAAALAYKAIWSAGNGALLERVHEYAEFWLEHDRAETATAQSPGPHTRRELELQLLHEFIGVTWKAQRDAQFSRLCSFLDWALPASLAR
ncbi:MAG TPA: hypothetical protein VHO25_06815 [Polyangiaceae bacterium]|nr:hypothetical protein [Polyangiaceae bacterium]